MESVTKTGTVKHREVTRALREEIESGIWRGGDRLPGEQDLARRFQVAPMTLRQAIAGLVDEGLLLRIRGKGTFVVSRDVASAETQASHAMGLLFPSDACLIDPYYFPEVLEGFQRGMEERGHRATVYSGGVEETAQLLPSGAAVACLLFDEAQAQIVEGLRDSGYQVLAINRYMGRRSIPCVRIDDAGGMERAVDHLVGLGHERIGFVRGPADNLDANDRLRGFRAAVKRHGLKAAPEEGDGFTEAAGYAAARKLLSATHRPTAIVCASDLSALGVIKAARDFGLSVPRGLSIVGFGDFSVADYMLPSLTTIRQRRMDLGACAAEALIQLAQDGDTAGAVLEADLIVRESTARNIAAMALA
jgi:LacI family transcriptional regulator